MPVRPKAVDEIIKKHTKGDLPSFFVYAKDKDEMKVSAPTNSTMCRIAVAIPSPYVKFSNTINKFDYRKLMNLTEGFDISEDNIVIQAYDYWVSHQHFFQTEDNGRVDTKQEDAYMYQAIRDRIVAITGKSMEYIVNTLVAYLYTVRKSSQKKMLWACFGDVIVGNLKCNLTNADPICPICGRRFKPRANANRLYCSDECLIKSNVLKQSARNMKKY